MSDEVKRDRGVLRVDVVNARVRVVHQCCPPKAISLSERLNLLPHGDLCGQGLHGCGICFMVCPSQDLTGVQTRQESRGGQAGWVRELWG